MFYLFLFFRITLNQLANLFQKKLLLKGAEPTFILFVSYLLITLIALPSLFFLHIPTSKIFWIAIILAALCDGVGNILLLYSLKISDLSVFGAIGSYKPIPALILSLIVLGEIPSGNGSFGILLIILGSTFLLKTNTNKLAGFTLIFRSIGFWIKISAICLFAVGSVYLKLAIMESDVIITFIFWALFGLPITSIVIAAAREQVVIKNIKLLIKNRTLYFFAIFPYLLMQLFTLYVFKRVFVAYSLAFFQLQNLVILFFAYKYLGEKDIFYKLIGSLIMICGVIFLSLSM